MDVISNTSARIRFSRQPSQLATSPRSEEHTSELQSQSNLVCRLLLEKKNIQTRLHLLRPRLGLKHAPTERSSLHHDHRSYHAMDPLAHSLVAVQQIARAIVSTPVTM